MLKLFHQLIIFFFILIIVIALTLYILTMSVINSIVGNKNISEFYKSTRIYGTNNYETFIKIARAEEDKSNGLPTNSINLGDILKVVNGVIVFNVPSEIPFKTNSPKLLSEYPNSKLKPQEKWASFQDKGDLFHNEQYKGESLYRVGVSTKLMIIDYPDDGSCGWSPQGERDSELDIIDDNLYIKVVLKSKTGGADKVLYCKNADLKAHTINNFNADTDINKDVEENKEIPAGTFVVFDIPSGLVQTGIAYPNSGNAKGKVNKDKSFNEEHADSSVIEFVCPPSKVKSVFNYNDYTLSQVFTGTDKELVFNSK